MANSIEYKCPCCGGAIAFNPGLQQLQCPYCDTTFTPESLQQYDAVLQQEQPTEMQWETPEEQEIGADGLVVFSCKSCGGEIVGDGNTAASSCPYCGSPIVMAGHLSGMLKPDLVIPFKLDKKAAKSALMKHLTGKRFLPKVFKDQNHIDEIKGIYVPFWLFDSTAQADLRYKATRTRAWSDSDYNYVETSFHSVSRSGDVTFDYVPVDGSRKLADDLMESIEPFDMTGAVDFQTAYLAGYFADKYDVDEATCLNRANERIRTATENAFASTIQGYETVTPDGGSIRLNGAKAKYALLPVWLLTTSWNDQKFTFAMNGQTGKLVGDLPMDKGAYWRTFALIGAGISAAVLAISYVLYLL